VLALGPDEGAELLLDELLHDLEPDPDRESEQALSH
jgi:hypothetical protein